MADEVVFDLEIGLDRYNRNLEQALRTGREFDTELKQIARTARAIDSALAEMEGKVEIDIQADTGSLDRADAKVAELEGATPKVTITTDVSALDTADSRIAAIEGATPKVDVTTDVSSLDTADSRIAEIEGASPKVTVNVSDTGLSDIENRIGRLETLGVIMVGVEIVTSGALSDLPIIGNIGDLTEAVRQYQAATGDFSDASREIISEEWTRGLAGSQEQIAAIAASLSNSGTPIEKLGAALKTVFDVAAVKKAGPEETLTELQNTVNSGLAEDIEQAGDVLVETGRKAQDAGGALEEFGRKFADAGATAAQVSEFFGQGVAAGIKPDKLGEIVNVLDVNLGIARAALAKGETTEQIDALKAIGLDTSPEAIEGYGEDALGFFGQVVGKINEGVAAGDITPIDADQFLRTILGSPLEEISASAFRGFDFAKILSAQTDPSALEDAFEPLTNTLTNALSELGRTAQSVLGESFRLAGQPLVEIFDKLPAKIHELSALIKDGMGLPEALEIVLEAPGLADTIRDLEAGLGNFIIDFELAIAQVLDVLHGAGIGGGGGDIRTAVADQATRQLQYEIKFADDNAEVATAINRAVSRGVDESDLADIVSTPIDELLAEGNTERAQAIVDSINSLANTVIAKISAPSATGPVLLETFEFEFPPDVFKEAAETGFQGLMDNLRQTRPWPLSISLETVTVEGTDALQEKIDGAAVDMRAAFDQTFADSAAPGTSGPIDAFGTLGFAIEAAGDAADVANPRLGALGVPLDKLWASNIQLNDSLNETAREAGPNARSLAAAYETEFPGILAYLEDLEAHWLTVKQAAYDAYLAQGGTPGKDPAGGDDKTRHSGGDVEGGEAYTIGVPGHEELFVPGTDGTVLPNSLTQGILDMTRGGWGGGSHTETNFYISTIINTDGMAQAVGAGDRLAQSIRGY